jgi:hypothetical protein
MTDVRWGQDGCAGLTAGEVISDIHKKLSQGQKEVTYTPNNQQVNQAASDRIVWVP